MRQLGGDAIVLTGQEMQFGRGETLADTARVLSRYVDAIMIRILDHEALGELARHATVPVINGLTRRSHPCQVMADVMTFEEHRGLIRGKTVGWCGDANNVLASWMHAAERFEFSLRVATPPELAPKNGSPTGQILRADIVIGRDPEEALDTASSPTPGCRWATRTARAGTTCSSAIRSTRARWRGPSPMPCSCIACRRTGARRSPTR